MRRGLVISAVILALVAIVGSSAMFTITETEQGLVLQFGEPKRVVTDAGLHFKLPFVQNVVIYERRVLLFDNPKQEVIAADQKRLVVDAFATFRIIDPLMFYQAVGTEEQGRLRLSNLLNASLRELIGQVTLVEVVSGDRQSLMDGIQTRINREAEFFGVDVIDVRIKRSDLPQENSEAIYRRMETEREREAREIRAQGEEQALRIRAEADRTRTVLISEARRQSEILRGQGDAEAVRIFAEAFGRDVEFFTFYRTMQAYRDSLSGRTTSLVLSPDSDFLRYLTHFQGIAPSVVAGDDAGAAAGALAGSASDEPQP